jgi:hypothetical protein
MIGFPIFANFGPFEAFVWRPVGVVRRSEIG